MTGLIIGGVIVLALIAFGVTGFNKLRTTDVGAQEALGCIDVQLTRRADLIPNLVDTVKGYAAHEREVFEDVARTRSQAQAATGVHGQAQAENELTRSIRQLLAVAENYPDLKASQNFLALQEELTGTESRIAYARQFYNDTVASLNTLIQTFPSSILARMGRFEPREFFDIEDSARGPVQVHF